MRKLALIGVLVFISGSGPSAAAGAGTVCDPSLEGRSDSPLAYRMRGDRCEGFYAQQVSALSIDVRSFVESFGPFDPQKTPKLPLQWQAPPGVARDVRLRAFCFKDRCYYRMDAAVPAGRRLYPWPADVLAAAQLGDQDLGLIAWIEMPGPGGIARKVYLPLRAGTAAAEEEGYQISIVPSVRLKEVHLTVSRLDANGNIASTLRRSEPLGYGYYPSNQPTRFSTGKLGAAGFYRLGIAATPASGDPVKQEIDFYHSGDGRSPQ